MGRLHIFRFQNPLAVKVSKSAVVCLWVFVLMLSPHLGAQDLKHPYQACRQGDAKADCAANTQTSSAKNLQSLRKIATSGNQVQVFKEKLAEKVAALLDMQIKLYDKMSLCFKVQAGSGCEQIRKNVKERIGYDFQEMKISNALANPNYPKNRKLQSEVPWLKYSNTTRVTQIKTQPTHLMRDLNEIPTLTRDEEKIAEQRYREAVLTNIDARSEHEMFYRENKLRYLEILSRNPALGYIKNSEPSDAELSDAFQSVVTRLRAFQQDCFGKSKSEIKWDQLFAFGPLANQILKDEPELCVAAKEAFDSYILNERMQKAGHAIAGFAAGFSCVLSGPVCLVAGLGVSAKGIHDAENFLETQFVSSISLDDLEDYSKLADAERAAWIEKVLMPTAMIGAGKGWSNFFKTSSAKVPAEVLSSSLLKTGLTEAERTELLGVSRELKMSDQAILHLAENRSAEELRGVSTALGRISRAEPLSREEAVRVAKFLEEANAKGLINFHLTKPENLSKIAESGYMKSKEYKMRIFAMSSRAESGQYFKMGNPKGFGEAEVIFQGEAAALFKDFKPTNAVHALHRSAGHQGTEPGRLIIDSYSLKDGALVVTKAHVEAVGKFEQLPRQLVVWALNGVGNVAAIGIYPAILTPTAAELNRDAEKK